MYDSSLSESDTIQKSNSESVTSSLRTYYLQQMGIDIWIPRNTSDSAKAAIQLMVITDASGDETLLNPREERLLKRMLTSVGVLDQDVSINTLASNPQQHATLATQIVAMQPRVIVALGSLVQQWLVMNGTLLQSGMYEYQGIPVFISYHPAHLLKNTRDKKRAYTDLLSVSQLLVN